MAVNSSDNLPSYPQTVITAQMMSIGGDVMYYVQMQIMCQNCALRMAVKLKSLKNAKLAVNSKW